MPSGSQSGRVADLGRRVAAGRRRIGRPTTALPQHLEHGNAVLVAAHGFPVNQKGLGWNGLGGIPDRRKSVDPVVTASCEQPHPHAVPADHHAIAIVLDLMNPVWAARKIAGGRGKAGLDKSGRSDRDTTGTKHRRDIPCPRFDSTVSPLGALPRSRRHPDHGIKLVLENLESRRLRAGCCTPLMTALLKGELEIPAGPAEIVP